MRKVSQDISMNLNMILYFWWVSHYWHFEQNIFITIIKRINKIFDSNASEKANRNVSIKPKFVLSGFVVSEINYIKWPMTAFIHRNCKA